MLFLTPELKDKMLRYEAPNINSVPRELLKGDYTNDQIYYEAFIKNSNKLLLKTIIVCVISLVVCTILINSTGFYLYNKAMGFSTAVLNYVNSHFGKDVSYFAYVAYRLIFKGQIFNNLFNYVLLFIVLPILKRFKIIF